MLATSTANHRDLVALIVAPIVVQYEGLNFGGWLIVAVLVGLLVWAIRESKRTAKPIG